MRIPRFAFALLVLAVVALASSLAVFKVGAHASSSVLLLQIHPDANTAYQCVLDTTKKSSDVCAVMFPEKSHMIGVRFETLTRDGDRMQLGVRTMASQMTPAEGGNKNGSMQIADLAGQPQTAHWFEAGQTMQLEIDGAGTVDVTGEWADHVPTLIGRDNLDPGPDELRVVSPLLLRDKQTLFDMEGGSVTATQVGMGVQIYIPGTGRFLISPNPMKEAVPAIVRLNRITFQLNGRDYLFITGAPVSREERVWVRYEPNFKPSGPDAPMIGAAALSRIAPDAVMPGDTMK